MADPTLPQVRRSQVGSVPVLWADAPAPHEIGLLFRVGRVDETLAVAGITHLVEHLAMPAEPVELECNALVSSVMTSFWARGELQELAEFVLAVAGRLRDLPLERMDVEKRILLAEEGLGTQAGEFLASRRFGAVGHGLAGFPQLGLRRLDEGMVRNWAVQRFTLENAALWVRGPLPDFPPVLPSGSRQPVPEPRPAPGFESPVLLNWPAEGVSLSLLVPHASEALLAGVVLHERATRRLRFESGLVYVVHAEGEALTGELASLTLHAECRLDLAAEVRDGVLALVDELAAEGPTPGELEAAAHALRTRAADPARLSTRLYDHAREHLVGLPWRPAAEELAQLGTVTPAEVAGMLREGFQTALLALPRGLDGSDRRFRPAPEAPPDRPVMGEEFRRRGVFRGAARRERLVVGRHGVTHVFPDASRSRSPGRRVPRSAPGATGRGVSGARPGSCSTCCRSSGGAERRRRGSSTSAPAGVVIDMGDEPLQLR